MVGPRLPPGAKRPGTIHTTQGKEADVVIGDYRNWSEQPSFQALAQGGKRGADARSPSSMSPLSGRNQPDGRQPK